MQNSSRPHIIRPRYDLYPRKAAPIKRNELIVAACDMVLVFWDGKSKGTLSSINLAKKLEKEISVITIEINEHSILSS